MIAERKKNAARNALAGITNRIVGLCIPFILRTAIIKILGEQYLGLNNLFSSVLQVLCLADLGFNSAIIYSMYKPIVDGDTDTICALMNLYKKIYFFIGCVVLIAGVSIIPFLKYLIKGSYPNDINIIILYLLYLLNTSISYLFFAHRKALLSAYQRSDIENNINSLTQIVFDIVRLLLLVLLRNYYIYVLFLPLTTFVSGLITSIKSYRLFPHYSSKGVVDRKIKKDIIKKVTALTIQRVGNTVSISLDNIIISSYLGLTILAIYGNYFYIVSSLVSLISVCISSATAGIGNSLVMETKEKNYQTFKKINMLNQWIIVWCIPCLLNLYQHFMKLWVGVNLMESNLLVLLMAIYFYVAESRKVVQVYKDAAGMWWVDKWRPLLGCLVNLTFNIISIRYIGVYGVILSTIISYLLVEMPWETIVFFNEYFKQKSKNYICEYIKDGSQYFICVCMASLISILICSRICWEGVCGFLIKAVICFVTSNIVFIFMFYKKEEFNGLKDILTEIIYKRAQ